MEYKGYFNIGYFTKTRGLKGELQLFFVFEGYDELDVEVVFVEIEGKLVPFFISSYKPQSNRTAYCVLEDVDHIDRAKLLVGKQVFLTEDKMPEHDESEFLLTDLKGFRVIDDLRGSLGEVTNVQAYPQQYIATVDVDGKEIMFPLNDTFMVDVDIDNKLLHVKLPDGLLDVYL